MPGKTGERTMMRIWLKPCDPDPAAKNSKTLRLTLLSPPWAIEGQEINHLGRKWTVIKTERTKGFVFDRNGVPNAR